LALAAFLGCDRIRPTFYTGGLPVDQAARQLEKCVNTENKPTSVVDDVVVSMDYTLRVEGVIVDSSDDEGPLAFIQGKGNIIKGLESQLYGMKTGESKHVVVPPTDGYGEYDPESVMEVSRREFPPEIPLKPGVELEVTDEDGDVQFARIVSVSKDAIKLDFNHPLAGKTLDFEITVQALRQPSAEELDHGHAHAEHDHTHPHHEEDEEVEFDVDFEEDEEEDEDELYYDDDDFDDDDLEDDLYEDDDDDFFEEDDR
jgi:FKBP-type peptidyl-prolyl cis-trans isomerase SlyD